MTFLNWAMLAGLVAVAIPIIIHLLNRQKATVVDWGAMRFLLDSLTARNRRILIEEVILMALRCLILALLVLALARPFLPSRSIIPWPIVLPSLLVAAMLFGIGAAMRADPARRKVVWSVAAGLVVAAVAASIVEQALQSRHWSLRGGTRDVAVVVDGSRSMRLTVDGRSNFDRAVEDAGAVLASLDPADAASLILAGPVPTAAVRTPTADRAVLASAFESLAPGDGPMGVVEALSAASAGLAEGGNPAKLIVLITDGQRIGWDLDAESRWRFLAAGLEEMPTPARLVVRTLPLPGRFHNAAVADVAFSRPVVGTDRPVRVDVKIAATGTVAAEPGAAILAVDGREVARKTVGRIEAGSAETVAFNHRFENPGPHVVTAEILSEDDLPADNRDRRVLEVVETLPVLIVDGRPSARPLDGAASFVALALTPRHDATQAHADAPAHLEYLVDPTVVEAADMREVDDLDRYALVILADVAKLPAETARAMATYVAKGGGLLVAPGGTADPEFYNAWMHAGDPVAPARLESREVRTDEPAHVAPKTFAHPALALLADTETSDVADALVFSWWQLAADETDPKVRIAGRLDAGSPLVVERRLGKGYVLMTALALDRRDSNLPSLHAFVPLTHELAYYLASPMVGRSNIPPGAEMTIELAARDPKRAPEAARLPQAVDIETPDGQRAEATLTVKGGAVRLTFPDTWQPGLYRFLPPADVAEVAVVRGDARGGVPFAVTGEPRESELVPLGPRDYEAAETHVDFFRAETTDQLTAAVAGDVPGEELWKYLALALLVGLLAEVGLTRWIAARRKLHSAAPVSFGDEIIGIGALRERTRAVLTGDREVPTGAKP